MIEQTQDCVFSRSSIFFINSMSNLSPRTNKMLKMFLIVSDESLSPIPESITVAERAPW